MRYLLPLFLLLPLPAFAVSFHVTAETQQPDPRIAALPMHRLDAVFDVIPGSGFYWYNPYQCYCVPAAWEIVAVIGTLDGRPISLGQRDKASWLFNGAIGDVVFSEGWIADDLGRVIMGDIGWNPLFVPVLASISPQEQAIATPEPSSASLLLICLLCLGASNHGRRRRTSP